MGDFEEQLLDKFSPGWRARGTGSPAGGEQGLGYSGQADLDEAEARRLSAERERRRSEIISAEHVERLLASARPHRTGRFDDGRWNPM